MDTFQAAKHTVIYDGGTFVHELGRISYASKPSAENAWVVARTPDAEFYKNYVISVTHKNYLAKVDFIQGILWSFIRHHHDGGLFGTWIDKESSMLYIDHVEFTTEQDARQKALLRGEKAIYNIVTEETVKL